MIAIVVAGVIQWK